MQEINIVNLLSKASGEIVVCACIACAVSFIIKKFSKLSNKSFIILSFIIGACIYFLVATILLDNALYIDFANSATCGALSGAVSLFVKRFAFMDNQDIKKQLQDLLSSIVLSEQLDEIVDNILQKLAGEKSVTKDGLKEILRSNLNATISEEELENIISFILSCCGFDNSNDENSDN